MVVAPLTTRRERALRCALGWWRAVCCRLLDEASTAGAVAAPADRRLRRRRGVDRVRPLPLVTALRRALPAFGQTGRRGFLGVARRVAAVRWVVRSVRDGRARRGAFGSVDGAQASRRSARR